MADLVDKAEAELSQIMARITMATMQSGLRLSATVGKGIVAAPYTAAAAVWNLSSNLINKATHPEQGKVSLRQFTQLTEGKRDVVKLDDKAVSREFERELKRHGVTWTVEQHRDGSRTFHVQGKDAELIQHALGVAAARVDEKIARGAPELQAEPQPVQHEQPQQEQSGQEQSGQEQPVAERDGQAPQQAAPERDEYDEPVQAESVGAHGTDELREDAPARSSAEDATPEHDQADATPERDEAVADRGGHSQQHEAPAPVADRPPRQLSPRDETREKVAKRIDQDVKAKKEELRQSKTRTRNRTPGRDTATEAREATRRR